MAKLAKILFLIFLILCTSTILIILSNFILMKLQSQKLTNNDLRKPGFIFVELETRKIDQYIEFFNKVANFKLLRREGNFALLQTNVGQLLLMSPDDLPNNHPFYGKVTGRSQGVGVEIGIVVKNLNQAFEAAKKSGWEISSDIINRRWGLHDFRILSPDGYYLRFTEGPSKSNYLRNKPP